MKDFESRPCRKMDSKLTSQEENLSSNKQADGKNDDKKNEVDRVYSIPVLNGTQDSDLQYANALLSSGEDKEALDDKWITSRLELWSFYSYYVGNCGVSGCDPI